MKRRVVLDTETTGLKAQGGDRIVEIGCVEMIDNARTGKTFHVYLNPERDVPEEAARVHGQTTEMLKDKPLFKDVAQAFLDFIGDDPLVIHNAKFDMGFINMELERAGHAPLAKDRAIDTLWMARKVFPGRKATLDVLCQHYNIDLSARTQHGALLDAELLADVYEKLSVDNHNRKEKPVNQVVNVDAASVEPVQDAPNQAKSA